MSLVFLRFLGPCLRVSSEGSYRGIVEAMRGKRGGEGFG